MPLTKRKVFSANRRTSTLLIGSVSPSPCQFVWFKCSQSFSSSLRAAMIAYRNDTCGMTMLANSVWHNVHMTRVFGLVLFGQAMVNMYWTLTRPYKGQSQFKRSLLHYSEEGNVQVSRRTNLRCDHFSIMYCLCALDIYRSTISKFWRLLFHQQSTTNGLVTYPNET
jgi:hypothetical protein